MTVFVTLVAMAAVPLVACVWCVISDRRHPIPELTAAEAAAQDAWEEQYDRDYWTYR